MGASESILVVEQDINSYENHDVIAAHPGATSTEALKLFKIYYVDQDYGDNYLEENLLCNDDASGQHLYAIVLINQGKTTQCFSLARHESEEDAREAFRLEESSWNKITKHFNSPN